MKYFKPEIINPSCCALCQKVLMDPVSTSCGHWFCRQCIRFYWDQSGPSSCPQCGERPRTGAGLLTANQSISDCEIQF
uniref:RING-type domain-containing protein n=1 Tax=Xiphophorus couchianus TaxID=32473 RepID=A0A3B5KXL5_9TELE